MSEQAETVVGLTAGTTPAPSNALALDELERFIEKELSLLAPGSVSVFPASESEHALPAGGRLCVWGEVSASIRSVINPAAVSSALSEVFERHCGSAPEAVVLSEPEPGQSRG